MRIALVTNGLTYGGAERLVETLAFDLRALNHEVRIIATTRDGPIGEILRAANFDVDILNISSFLDARIPFRLASILRKFRPQVLHSHLMVSDMATTLASFGNAQTLRVSTIHNPGVELSTTKKKLWPFALARMDYICPVSNAVKHSLPKTILQKYPQKIKTIYPSQLDLSISLKTKEEARRELGLPEDCKLVLGIGRLHSIKGFDILAKAARLIQTPNVIFAIMGDGPQRQSLENTSLKLLGARMDAPELVKAADVFVQPSRSEGFPQAPLQAMAGLVPVVATSVGGTPELIEHNKTGYLIEKEDPKALATYIDKVLNNSDEAETLTKNAYEQLSVRSLTRQGMVKEISKIYHSGSKQ